MKIAKRILKWSLYLLLVPAVYIIISLILSSITIGRAELNAETNKVIYLSTNGVHLDIIMPIENIDKLLLQGIKHAQNEKYLSFGWGDENFYINTPTWADLTFSNAFSAMFLKSSTLMHVTRHKNKSNNWIEIKISEAELEKLNSYLQNSFELNENGIKMILENQGYSSIDDFYKAKGNYSIFKTCNSWANTGFKNSGLESCLWTPFDFGLLSKYE
jgi:uncharacterized protein (TIGR02117 family)